MTTETLNTRTAPRARRTADGKIAAKPNYALLAIGLALVLLQILIVSKQVESPVANAVPLALGITLALYGVYPVSVMSGEFTGILGRLAVTGPAALGIFVFAYTLHSLKEEAQQRKNLSAAEEAARLANEAVLLMTSATNRHHNSRTIDGTTVTLLDVDSFADDSITHVVDQLDSTLQSNGLGEEKEREEEVRRLLASVIPHLRLGMPHQRKALAAVEAYLNDATDTTSASANQAWKAAIQEAAADAADSKHLLSRVKRLPFAVVKVAEAAGPRFHALSEHGRLRAGSRTYGIPVIANPAKRYTPHLEEAVVLTAAAQ